MSEPRSSGQFNESHHRIGVLDGYRALAILAVVFYHYIYLMTANHDVNALIPAKPVLGTLVQYGWLGVEFFFVISGFVILMTLERCRNIGDFAIRRFARLWPPLFVAATLTTFVMTLIGPPEWAVSGYDYIVSLLIIDPNALPKVLHHPGTKFVDGAYWSLWVEVRFYALAAVFYLFARRNFIKYWLMLQLAMSYFLLLQPLQDQLAQSLLRLFFFPIYLPYFTIGVCLYEIYSKGALRNLAIVGAFLAGSTVLASIALHLVIYQESSAAICIAINLAIFVLFYLFVTGNRLTGIFRTRPLVVLGQASYSLYLIHMHIGVSLIRYAMGLGMPYPLALTGTIAFVVATALLLFRYVEVPAKSLILRYSPNLVDALERRVPWLSYGAGAGAKVR